jgi:hypothetical protein
MPAHTPEYVAAKKAQGHGMQNLNDYAAMTLWPTPTSLTPARNGNSEAGNSAELVAIREHCLWRTPRSSDGEKGGPNQAFGAGGQPLPSQAASMWATPSARDYRSPNSAESQDRRNADSARGQQLPNQVAHDGLPAPTEKPAGSLNPMFVSWLMGYPPEWLNCAPSATRSSRKSRQS